MNRKLLSVLATLGLLGLKVPSAHAQGFFGPFEPPGTPIPEPGILSLIAIGGVAVGVVALRRRRKKK